MRDAIIVVGVLLIFWIVGCFMYMAMRPPW